MPDSGDYDIDSDGGAFGQERVSHDVLVERVRHMIRSINWHRSELERELKGITAVQTEHGKQLHRFELWQTKIMAYVAASAAIGGVMATIVGKVVDHAWK